jgi:hypothetical protein
MGSAKGDKALVSGATKGRRGRVGETAVIDMVLLRFGADALVRCEEDGVIARLKQLRKK